MSEQIGLTTEAIERSTTVLKQYLADSLVLYVKTQGFHWNIVSSDFVTLHELLQRQYEDLAESIDETAERIRMLGKTAPATLRGAAEQSRLDEVVDMEMADTAMLHAVLADHESLATYLREQIAAIQSAGDEGTADYLIARLRTHEKTAWFVRSTLAGR